MERVVSEQSSLPVGTVERAFQLAPECASLDELKAKLRSEGCTQIDEHLRGPSIRGELKKLLAG